MFTRIMDKTMRSVKYEFSPGPAGTEAPAWTIERPGTYAEGREHMRHQATSVRSVGFSLFRASEYAEWEVRGIVIEVEPRDGEPGTIVTTVKPDSLASQPMWLNNLAARAVSE
jgi:hypothetical protein